MRNKQKVSLSARIDAELRAEMEKWAEERKLPISWLAERVLEIGWPIFQEKENIPKAS